MKISTLICLGLAATTTSHAIVSVIVVAEDYDGNQTIGVSPNGNISTVTTMADPDPAQSDMALAVDLSGGTQWGALDPNGPNNIAFSSIPVPAGNSIIPGESTATLTYDIFVPAGTTALDNNDTSTAIIRMNNANGATNLSSGVRRLVAGGGTILPRDQWVTVTATGVINPVDASGAATVGLTPIISLRDADAAGGGGADALGGTFAYIDNIQFSVVAIPEPTRALLLGCAGFGFFLRRKRN